MYKIKVYNFPKKYLLAELINIFIRPDQYTFLEDDDEVVDHNGFMEFNVSRADDKDQIKRDIYTAFSQLTGDSPEWGVLTGIRPVKLCGELYEKLSSKEETRKYLKDYYYISDEKIDLIMDIYFRQKENIGTADSKSAGIYIGIPFCPTRCTYCSFASNQKDYSEIHRYTDALLIEIREVGEMMHQNNIYSESVYIGGGTPTTLSPEDLDRILTQVEESFDLSKMKEFTVEAGRPDTITGEKLQVLRNHGIKRISINPQTLKDETLPLIGRHHTVDDFYKAYEMARKAGFECINTDLIAGLPEESLEDFEDTLKEIIRLNPENVTIHSLAVKRASKLKEADPDFHYVQGQLVREMVALGRKYMAENGYRPYYLYRQKHMSGACENTGYCKEGFDSVYNMRIMDEHQIIIALGAGGISKSYFPEENRLERVPNVTNYKEYISRIDEMIDRKRKNIFMEVD